MIYMSDDTHFNCEVDDSSPIEEIKKRIVAVIPTYEDKFSIGSVVVHALSHASQVIVVDDCSRDDTAHVAKLAGAIVTSMPQHSGRAKALLTGLKEADEYGCWAAVILSGDRLQRDDYFEKVAAPIINGEADIVIGSGFQGQRNDSRDRDDLGQQTNPPSNPARKVNPNELRSELLALSSRALMSLDFSMNDGNIESGLIAHFIANGFTIKEVPMAVPSDVSDEHQGFASEKGKERLSNVVSTLSRERPLLFIGLPGVICAFAGLVLVLLTMNEAVLFGSLVIQLAIGAGMLLVGAYAVFSGLALNSLALMRKADQ